MPGALSSAVTMFVFGRIANKFDPRLMIGLGALMTTGTGVLLMGLNPDTGVQSIFWPLILRAVGSVIMFMPLSLAALGPLPPREIAAGAGIYSLTRQMGSSVGIALITTMLSRREAAHRSALVDHVSIYRQPVLDRLNMMTTSFNHHGGDLLAARHRAVGLLDRIVNGQAALLSYSDIFFYVAAAFVLSLPLLLLLGGKPRKAAATEAASAAH